jgi:hypothetical protein
MDRKDLLAGMATLGIMWVSGSGDAMERGRATGVLFIAGFGPIVRGSGANRKLYGEALVIPFKEETGGYLSYQQLEGRAGIRTVAAFSGSAIVFWQRFLA